MQNLKHIQKLSGLLCTSLVSLGTFIAPHLIGSSAVPGCHQNQSWTFETPATGGLQAERFIVLQTDKKKNMVIVCLNVFTNTSKSTQSSKIVFPRRHDNLVGERILCLRTQTPFVYRSLSWTAHYPSLCSVHFFTTKSICWSHVGIQEECNMANYGLHIEEFWECTGQST